MMIYAGTNNLFVNRNQPFLYTVEFPGFDFTGAAAAMQVRAYPDAQGDAILSLENSIPSAQGLSFSVIEISGETTSTVQIRINETTIEDMIPPPSGFEECSNNVTLYYDLVITGGGYIKTRWMQGKFIILAGVTQ